MTLLVERVFDLLKCGSGCGSTEHELNELRTIRCGRERRINNGKVVASRQRFIVNYVYVFRINIW